MDVHNNHNRFDGRKLVVVIILNIFITLIQISGSIISGSLVLLSDALHNFSDVLSLVISWWANKISSKRKTEKRTFGYGRAEIIAAFFNALVLGGIGLYIISKAILEFFHTNPVNSNVVIYLGIMGVVFNGFSVFYLREDINRSLNIKAAYLHLLSDVMTSLAVVFVGCIMKYFGIVWIDPIISIFIAFYIIFSSFNLIKNAYSILMEFAPPDINIRELQNKIVNFNENIENVHHLHIWRFSEHEIYLEAHLDFKINITLKEANIITSELKKMLIDTFGINHCTFQNEFGVDDCKKLINEH